MLTRSPDSMKLKTESHHKKGIKRKRDSDSSLPYLNRVCRAKGGRNFIQDCDMSDEAKQKELIKEYCAGKRARLSADTEKKVQRIANASLTAC